LGGKHTPDALGLRRLCTIKEIAEASEVGVGTVHRVLKGKSVGGANLLKVRKAIFDLNQKAISLACFDMVGQANPPVNPTLQASTPPRQHR